MHPHNSFPTPSGLRLCYWHPDYVPECQPFCLVSRLSDQENKACLDFEELKFFERLEKTKLELQRDASPSKGQGAQDDEFIFNGCESVFIDVKKAVALYFSGPKKLYFFQHKKVAKGFGLYNIQTNDAAPSKTAEKLSINRSDFLTR